MWKRGGIHRHAGAPVIGALCLAMSSLGGCAPTVYVPYVAPVGAETASLRYNPTRSDQQMRANLQYVWAGSNLTMTDATTFRHFNEGATTSMYSGADMKYPEQVEAGKRMYLYTLIAQGNGRIARHCRYFISFIPATNGHYIAADYGDGQHCAIRIMDLNTNELAPGFEIHDAEPLSSRWWPIAP